MRLFGQGDSDADDQNPNFTKGQVNPTIRAFAFVLNTRLFLVCFNEFDKMTTFAKSVIIASVLIVALGWLADGGSVDIDAAQNVERLKGIPV